MRGVSAVVWLVVVIIVMLVAALVILSMFGGAITPVASLADATNICKTTCAPLCQAQADKAKAVPIPTWKTATMRVGDTTVSCESLVGATCTACLS